MPEQPKRPILSIRLRSRADASDMHSDLVRFVEDHDGFRRNLDELADLLAEGSVEEFSNAFDRFAVSFSKYEEREERLMAKLVG